MRGLLADVNVQGHLPYLRRLLEGEGLLEILAEMVPSSNSQCGSFDYSLTSGTSARSL